MTARNLLLALLSLLLITSLIQAEERPFIDEPEYHRSDVQEKEWKEGEFQLPDKYQDKNLQEFQLDDSGGNFRYYIDRKSLHTSKDRVTRYILVIRSKNGIDNSSYEGIRCGKRVYKVYAYGSKQGFQRLPATGWQRIKKTGHENYRHVLYNDLLCDSNMGKANPAADVFRAMQNNKKVNSSPMLDD